MLACGLLDSMWKSDVLSVWHAVRSDHINSVVLVPLCWVDEGKSWGCVCCPVGIAAIMEIGAWANFPELSVKY